LNPPAGGPEKNKGSRVGGERKENNEKKRLTVPEGETVEKFFQGALETWAVANEAQPWDGLRGGGGGTLGTTRGV